MRLRVYPVKQFHNGWNVQRKRWWGWVDLSRFHTPQEANSEMQRMLDEQKESTE